MYNEELNLGSLFENNFQADKSKILFSRAFKRMANKTQVWSNSSGSNGHKHRTRLTHSIEVSSLSYAVANKLGLNAVLSEILGLAHDVGHAPFGHSGQDVLDECLKAATGGKERFEHNDQAIRVFSVIEGLELSPIVLQGLRKRNQIETVSQYGEAQVTDECDAIAYTAGDIEDAVGLGYFDIQDLVEASDLVRTIIDAGVAKGLTGSNLIRHLHNGLVVTFSNDLINNSMKNIKELGLIGDDIGEQISNIKGNVICLSKPVLIELQVLTRFMMKNVYRSAKMTYERSKTDHHLRGAFNRLMENQDLLKNTSYYKRYQNGETSLARMVCDYISGCDDKFIMEL